MYDSTVLREQLEMILEALERLPVRFASIMRPDDFASSPEGMEHLDSICMVLLASGEAFKKIDAKTDGKFLSRYPQVDWSGVKGVRDVVAHGYFDIDAEEVFGICRDDVPMLIETVRKMIHDLSS